MQKVAKYGSSCGYRGSTRADWFNRFTRRMMKQKARTDFSNSVIGVSRNYSFLPTIARLSAIIIPLRNFSVAR
jgi:hypothetical protein